MRRSWNHEGRMGALGLVALVTACYRGSGADGGAEGTGSTGEGEPTQVVTTNADDESGSTSMSTIGELDDSSTGADDESSTTSPPLPPPGELDVTVRFPLGYGHSVTDAVTVRGIAQGTNLTEVTVDGQIASSDDAFATWQVTVPLEIGVNELEVVAIASDGGTDVRTLTVVREDVLRDPRWLTVTDDGQRAYILDWEQGMFEVDLATGRRHLLDGFSFSGNVQLDYDPTTDRILYVDADNELRAFDPQGGVTELIHTFVGGASVRALAVDPASNRAFALHSLFAATAIDLNTGIGSAFADPAPWGYSDLLEVDEANNRLVTVTNADEILYVDLDDQSFTTVPTDADIDMGFTVSPDGLYGFSYRAFEQEIVRFDLTTGAVQTWIDPVVFFRGLDRRDEGLVYLERWPQYERLQRVVYGAAWDTAATTVLTDNHYPDVEVWPGCNPRLFGLSSESPILYASCPPFETTRTLAVDLDAGTAAGWSAPPFSPEFSTGGFVDGAKRMLATSPFTEPRGVYAYDVESDTWSLLDERTVYSSATMVVHDGSNSYALADSTVTVHSTADGALLEDHSEAFASRPETAALSEDTLWGVVAQSGVITAVDRATGAATELLDTSGEPGIGNIDSIIFDEVGQRLLGVDEARVLFSVDLATGTVQILEAPVESEPLVDTNLWHGPPTTTSVRLGLLAERQVLIFAQDTRVLAYDLVTGDAMGLAL